MKIKSWLKEIWDKWFPEVTGGISESSKRKVSSSPKRYPLCYGTYLPSDIPIMRKTTKI